jgi:purine-binding chemotaxis protein CheW
MTTPSTQGDLRVCLFRLAEQDLALRLESVSEIVPMAALARPPARPAILEGFLNLRGNAVPVLQLASLLGLPPEPLQLYTPLMLVRGGPLPLALVVSNVTGIITVPAAELVPIPPTESFNGCIDSRLTVAGRTIHLLAADRLLLTKEEEILAEFHATETTRLGQIDAVTP